MLIAASVIPLVVDTGRILALDVSEKDREIQEALDEVRVVLLSLLLSLVYPPNPPPPSPLRNDDAWVVPFLPSILPPAARRIVSYLYCWDLAC